MRFGSQDKIKALEKIGHNHMSDTRQPGQSLKSNATTPDAGKRGELRIIQTTQWFSDRNENWQSLPGGCRAFSVSVLFLALGFVTLWFMRAMLNMQQDAVLIAILFVPVLVYLILSGTLQEISAGSVSAKFNNAAQKPLFNKGDTNIMPMEIEQVEMIMKQGLGELQAILQKVSNSQYIVLTVMLGKGFYTGDDLLGYLKALSQSQNFTFLAILEGNGKIFGYITGWQAIQIIEYEMNPVVKQNAPVSFVQAINQGLTEELRRYGLMKETVKTTDTNVSALKKMTKRKMNLIIATDESGQLKGVVAREQVLSKLMLTLTR